MDKDLIKQFSEKNESMLKDKLVLDLNNNKDSLFQALDNFFRQKFIESKAKLIDIYESANVNLDSEQLNEFLSAYSKQVQKTARDLIVTKYKLVKDMISEVNLKESTLNKYCDFVKVSTDKYDYNFINGLNEYLEKNISKILLELAMEKDETTTANKRATELLKITLPASLCKKTIEYLKDRDGAIINNAKESFKRIKKTNSITTGK